MEYSARVLEYMPLAFVRSAELRAKQSEVMKSTPAEREWIQQMVGKFSRISRSGPRAAAWLTKRTLGAPSVLISATSKSAAVAPTASSRAPSGRFPVYKSMLSGSCGSANARILASLTTGPEKSPRTDVSRFQNFPPMATSLLYPPNRADAEFRCAERRKLVPEKAAVAKAGTREAIRRTARGNCDNKLMRFMFCLSAIL
mmetsp:Transcript_49534/g.96903  ORF Transcript_49534/g.96903 Transcript_49534/m.96903 type:complete len:200 (-) Transcript_49534:60-659(-)